MYFLLTIGFTYFYTAFTFKPDETAEQLRKNGGYIPGIRPGRPTQDYLARVVSRITFAGALFLGIVAVSPGLVGLAFPDLGAIGLGGTSLLIVVSVVVETMKQIEAQLMMRNYEGFIRMTAKRRGDGCSAWRRRAVSECTPTCVSAARRRQRCDAPLAAPQPREGHRPAGCAGERQGHPGAAWPSTWTAARRHRGPVPGGRPRWLAGRARGASLHGARPARAR